MGKRFELLKSQYNNQGSEAAEGPQASSGSLPIPNNQAKVPPRPTRKARDYNDYQTVGGKKVVIKDRLTPTGGGRSK